jgi:hypothetical protein
MLFPTRPLVLSGFLSPTHSPRMGEFFSVGADGSTVIITLTVRRRVSHIIAYELGLIATVSYCQVPRERGLLLSKSN